MEIYHSLDQIKKLRNAIVTSGTFDGVHIGHQKILARLNETSQADNGESVVLTFWPHPRMVVSDNRYSLHLLSTIDEKIELLASLNIDHLVIIPFTRSFSELTSIEFIQQILVEKIGTKKLIIGYDHRFGKNREGSFEFLKANCHQFGFEVEEIPRQDIEDMAISSTRIRKNLLHGNITEANELLGRNYGMSGIVVKGKQLGRTLGFPTANIQISEEYKLIPENGVYIINAIYGGNRFNGMLNIGVRPTVDGIARTIEANLFDFEKDIYGEELTIELLEYLRPELKFDSLEELMKNIQIDKQNSIHYFNSNS